MLKFLGKLLDNNEKELKKLRTAVDEITALEPEMKKLKDTDFAKRTAQLRTQLGSGRSLDDIMPEGFALVREAARRTLGQRHYDEQLIAAITLHQGKVAEQKTGEGKTLSATPAMYINALSGRGVHLVTVNDYLARRDAGWMGSVFHLLGISVSAIINDQSFIYDDAYEDDSAQDTRLRHLRPVNRKEAYKADITYGINSEFGFDYLRDNMVSNIDQVVQREHHYAIVDEVDSVLIDEARTPHIISAPQQEATTKYYDYAKIVEKLNPDVDFSIDEKLRTAHLTDHGILKVEKLLGLGNIYEKDFQTVHHIEAALKARALFRKEKEYIVKDGKVVIVDEFTGRLLQGRRFSEGIHQAIEAKEGVAIQQESKTLATVSLQNYFRNYEKLAGMTGTASTEAEEFHKIYELDVVVIPTHRPVIRADHPDAVYKTTRAKYAAIADEVAACHKKGQPVLVGTTSIDKNEVISELLKRKGVPHNVLNAKNHMREATIIAEAGMKGAVTVATNMAGRGVDIILGGPMKEQWEFSSAKEYEAEKKRWQKLHDEVLELGGLHVVGSERHESRRIDNQLRGRSGRQGDPGSSRFFVSLEDEIMRLFGGEQVAKLMTMFNLPEDMPLEHGMVSRAIEQAQVKVEGFHFDSRKHLVEYDDVLNKQREIIYRRRRKVLEGADMRERTLEKVTAEVAHIVGAYATEDGVVDADKIVSEIVSIIPFDEHSQKELAKQMKKYTTQEEVVAFITKLAGDTYESKEQQVGEDVMRQVERWVYLNVIDNHWMLHLDAIDDLRSSIGLRGYGQREPLVEYKNEAFSMFEQLMAGIDGDIVRRIFKVQVQMQQPAGQATDTALPTRQPQEAIETSITRQARHMRTNTANGTPKQKTVVKNKKLGRNDPCWCGSGKKFKKCHYPEMG